MQRGLISFSVLDLHSRRRRSHSGSLIRLRTCWVHEKGNMGVAAHHQRHGAPSARESSGDDRVMFRGRRQKYPDDFGDLITNVRPKAPEVKKRPYIQNSSWSNFGDNEALVDVSSASLTGTNALRKAIEDESSTLANSHFGKNGESSSCRDTKMMSTKYTPSESFDKHSNTEASFRTGKTGLGSNRNLLYASTNSKSLTRSNLSSHMKDLSVLEPFGSDFASISSFSQTKDAKHQTKDDATTVPAPNNRDITGSKADNRNVHNGESLNIAELISLAESIFNIANDTQPLPVSRPEQQVPHAVSQFERTQNQVRPSSTQPVKTAATAQTEDTSQRLIRELLAVANEQEGPQSTTPTRPIEAAQYVDCGLADCTERFRDMDEMKMHKYYEHGDCYCPKCDLGFADYEHLANHLRESNEHFACIRCVKEFRSRHTLNYHMREVRPLPQHVSKLTIESSVLHCWARN